MAMKGSAPFVQLIYQMQGTGLSTFSKQVDTASKELTSRLRWLGRDFMRLGASVNQFAMMGQQLFTSFSGASFALSGAIEDLGDVFIDLSDAIFDPLQPVIDAIIPVLETLVDIFEMIPEPIRAGLGLAIIFIGLILPLVGKAVGLFLNFQGAIMLAAGALRGIAHEGMSFKRALDLLKGAMSGHINISQETKEAGMAEINLLKQQEDSYLKLMESTNLGTKAGRELKEEHLALMTTIQGKEKAMAKSLWLEGQITQGQYDEVISGKSLEQANIKISKSAKQEKKSLLGTAGGFLKAGVAMAGFSLFAIALQPLMEELGDLFGSIGDAILTAVEPFIPMIETIGDLIDENPQLVGTILLIVGGFLALITILPQLLGLIKLLGSGLGSLFGGFGGVAKTGKDAASSSYMNIVAMAALIASIAALVGAFALLVKLASESNYSMTDLLIMFTTFIGVLTGFVFGLSFAVQMLSKVGPNVSQAVMSLGLLVLAIGALVLSFTAFIAVAGMFGFSAQDVMTMLFSLVGAITTVVGVMVALGFIVTTLQVVLKPLEILLLVIAVAALAIGVAFLLAGIGVSMAADAIIRMAQNIGTLIPLVPVLFLLAAGFFALMAATAMLGPTALFASIGIAALAGTTMLLAAAIFALAAALNSIPNWAQGAVGGILGGIGGIFKGIFGGIPGLQEGGFIKEAGVAYLHPGEVVVPAGGGMGRYTDYSTTSITISGADKSPKEIAKEVVEEINKLQEKKYRRSEYGA